MHKELKKDLKDFNSTFKEYLRVELDSEKLVLLVKLSQFGAYLFKVFIILYLSILIVGFFLGALAVWYGKMTGNYFIGVLIAGAALIVVAVLLILLRKKIAVRSVLLNLSRILLNDERKRD